MITDDLAEAIAAVPKGFWWTVGVCGLTAHASVGPDRAFIGEPILSEMDGGFDADLPQPSTPAAALRDATAQAAAALRARDPDGNP